ncbi:reverse transcriptase domain-containing protein, partial [Tanacetum coccineum]
PHHGFSPLHQTDTFYNGLNQSDQDSLNSAAGGNLLTRNTPEALTIIENKSKVRTSRNTSSSIGSSSLNDAITALTKQVKALGKHILDMQKPVHSIQVSCQTCGGPHPYYECQAAGGYTQRDVYAATGNYNAAGIEVDRAKVDVISKLPPPTMVKEIRSFLGHASFYRRFIQDFSKIVRPMTHLLEKETPFVFSKECFEPFEYLKKKLTEDPILMAPDCDLPFKIMCDASDFAVGAVLGQRKNQYFQPIHYTSKTLSDAQTLYTTTEKVLLAVVYAFEKFRSYNIRDIKGAENLAADHLSRLENPHKRDLVEMEMYDNFPHESLNMIALNDENEP